MSNKISYFRNNYEGRRDDCMCTILKKIYGKTPIQLLKEYNISMKPPIDLAELLEKIKISTIAMDFTEVEKIGGYEQGSVLGAVYSKGNDLGIFFKETDSWHRQKFTIAHELGHCCLHFSEKAAHIEYRHNSIHYESYDEQKETGANIFAGELLIPSDVLIKYYNKMIIPSLKDLANIFDVSYSVMAARLDFLNMAYYKDVILEDN